MEAPFRTVPAAARSEPQCASSLGCPLATRHHQIMPRSGVDHSGRAGQTGVMRYEELGGQTDHDDDRLTSRGADAADTAERAGREVASAGREVASSRWMRGLARAGLLARGVNYLLVGLLAVQIALGS